MPSSALTPELRTSAARAPDPLAALVARMCNGDEAALAALYDAAVDTIYGLAIRIVRDPQVAEEVTEDTFFHAWRDAKRYDASRGRVMTWLMVMGRSRALDALRRVDPAHLREDIEALSEQVVDPADSAEAFVQALRLNSAVRAAVDALPPAERHAIALSFFRGLTHQEIADAWHMPLGSVKTIMNRAFTALRATCSAHWIELNQ